MQHAHKGCDLEYGNPQVELSSLPVKKANVAHSTS